MPAIVTQAQPLMPSRLSEAAREKLQRLREATSPDGESAFSISKAMAPSSETRTALQRRCAELVQCLASAGPERVEAPVDLLLGVLRLKIDSPAEATARRAAYMLALADLPLFAVEIACTEALRGRVGDPRFAPLPGELHKAAERAMAPFLRERRDIERVLLAKVREPLATTQEERAEIVARIRRSVSGAVREMETA